MVRKIELNHEVKGENTMEQLQVKCKGFEEGDWIPIRYTGRGEDLSPELELIGIAPGAKSIAITLEDASHPIFLNFNHWVIWNLPVQSVIPEGIAHGKYVGSLGTTQGKAYGRHKYRGPKPPLKAIHNYVFTVYILDCKIELDAGSRKRDLLNKMEGHILQQATLTGKFQSRRE